MNPPPPLHPVAIGYARVSTDVQVRDGISLDAQRAKLMAWAALNGYELVNIHTDAGISGKRQDTRPALQAALTEACSRGGALVAYSLSRIARSTRDAIDIAERLEKAGADLVSLTERLDTSTAAGRMTFRLLAVLSEFERDQLGERTRMAMTHLRRQGRRISGALPYGWELADDGRTLTPSPAERSTILVMQKLKAEGMSYPAIGRELERRGIPTKQGGTRWNERTIRIILIRAAKDTP